MILIYPSPRPKINIDTTSKTLPKNCLKFEFVCCSLERTELFSMFVKRRLAQQQRKNIINGAIIRLVFNFKLCKKCCSAFIYFCCLLFTLTNNSRNPALVGYVRETTIIHHNHKSYWGRKSFFFSVISFSLRFVSLWRSGFCCYIWPQTLDYKTKVKVIWLNCHCAKRRKPYRWLLYESTRACNWLK